MQAYNIVCYSPLALTVPIPMLMTYARPFYFSIDKDMKLFVIEVSIQGWANFKSHNYMGRELYIQLTTTGVVVLKLHSNSMDIHLEKCTQIPDNTTETWAFNHYIYCSN